MLTPVLNNIVERFFVYLGFEIVDDETIEMIFKLDQFTEVSSTLLKQDVENNIKKLQKFVGKESKNFQWEIIDCDTKYLEPNSDYLNKITLDFTTVAIADQEFVKVKFDFAWYDVDYSYMLNNFYKTNISKTDARELLITRAYSYLTDYKQVEEFYNYVTNYKKILKEN